MGFLGDISRGLFGGSESRSDASSRSGFSMLPPELQKAFKDYATQTTEGFTDGGFSGAFTPADLTSTEEGALSDISAGVTPTAETIGSDISMLMNPFDESVINEINRQSMGDASILNQQLARAGQVGSNRSMLGASDIERTRLNDIARFKQDQYNKALDASLGSLSESRRGDIGLQFAGGELERGLEERRRLAPVTALGAYGQALGAIPQSGGATSTSTGRSTTDSGDLSGALGKAFTVFG